MLREPFSPTLLASSSHFSSRLSSGIASDGVPALTFLPEAPDPLADPPLCLCWPPRSPCYAMMSWSPSSFTSISKIESSLQGVGGEGDIFSLRLHPRPNLQNQLSFPERYFFCFHHKYSQFLGYYSHFLLTVSLISVSLLSPPSSTRPAELWPQVNYAMPNAVSHPQHLESLNMPVSPSLRRDHTAASCEFWRSTHFLSLLFEENLPWLGPDPQISRWMSNVASCWGRTEIWKAG